jgi:hypothetical protein
MGRLSVTSDVTLLLKFLEEIAVLLVPGERIELPTNGLQNRCSTAELTRRIKFGSSERAFCHRRGTARK